MANISFVYKNGSKLAMRLNANYTFHLQCTAHNCFNTLIFQEFYNSEFKSCFKSHLMLSFYVLCYFKICLVYLEASLSNTQLPLLIKD